MTPREKRIVMKEWMKVIPESEIATYQRAGFLNRISLGARPALIVVDVTYGFTGSKGLTLEEAIKEFPTACGPASWAAMPNIAKLIELFRNRNAPIVFTCVDTHNQGFSGRATKSKRAGKVAPGYGEFPPAISPQDGDWVLGKTKASAFFQTPLLAYLVKEKVDSVVVCGVSTSGCVRATVVDSCSNGFDTFVVDDACFDRSWFAHCSNLFDMSAKYAHVLSLHEVDAECAPR
ncbi:isochorismatase family protein [Streptomyces sp. NPDC046900]|uniref:cysteine hydrolase family protein n=1 Tax=Streptomyces sp. NPDC046900 TaxID=3155473 RepID=UPI0033E7B4AB